MQFRRNVLTFPKLSFLKASLFAEYPQKVKLSADFTKVNPSLMLNNAQNEMPFHELKNRKACHCA
jgi:hypothetical protein